VALYPSLGQRVLMPWLIAWAAPDYLGPDSNNGRGSPEKNLCGWRDFQPLVNLVCVCRPGNIFPLWCICPVGSPPHVQRTRLFSPDVPPLKGMPRVLCSTGASVSITTLPTAAVIRIDLYPPDRFGPVLRPVLVHNFCPSTPGMSLSPPSSLY